MMGKTHMAAGALFFLGGAPIVAGMTGMELGTGQMIAGTMIATAAGLLPDIDHPDAMLTHGKIPFVKFLGPLAKPVALFLSIPPRIVGMLSRSVMGHRGGTHSLAFLVLWTLAALPLYAAFAGLIAWVLGLVLSFTPLAFDPSAVWQWELANLGQFMGLTMLAVGLGYLSHLFVDSLNTAPIPWLWPVSKRRFFFLPKGLRIRVDSPVEFLFRMCVLLACVVLAWFAIVVPGFHEAKRQVDKATTGIEKTLDEPPAAKKAGARSGRDR